MWTPPDMRTPPGGTDGGAEVRKFQALSSYRIPPPGSTEIAAAVSHVRTAGLHLRAASFTLDDAGFRCEELDDLAADTAALVSAWRGHGRPAIREVVPDFMAAAAREWRRQNRRSY